MNFKKTQKAFTKIILVLVFCNFTLQTIQAQTADLYYQIKGHDFNIQNTRKALSNLERSVVYGKSSVKKKKARVLQQNAQQIADESYSAYLKAKQIVKKLEADKNYKLAEKVGTLRSNLHGIYYAADALANKYCQWMINKPKVHKGKSFKSMSRAFNTIIEHYNKAQKNKKVLNDVIAWESYKSLNKN